MVNGMIGTRLSICSKNLDFSEKYRITIEQDGDYIMNKKEKFWAFWVVSVLLTILIFAFSYSVMLGLLVSAALVGVFFWSSKNIPEEKPVPNEEIEKELEQ